MTCCSSSCKRSLLSSTIALKAQMAVTGLILYGFVVMHMVGNLKAFGGEINGVPMLDIYARYLREMGEHLFGHGGVLWGVRIVLLLSLLLHVEAAVKLKSRNLESKPIKYRIFDYRASTVAARTMLVGGVFLFFFVIFHILHFTT
ncbi:MAG: succinate dehydrogenase, partial [Candidatus Dadabacteria bacterium]